MTSPRKRQHPLRAQIPEVSDPWAPLRPLEERVAYLIDTSQKKRVKYRQLGSRMFILQAVLASVTTVVIGLATTSPRWLKAVALVTSAGAALLAVLQGYFAYRDRWRHYTTQVYRLYSLRAAIDRSKSVAQAYAGGTLTQEQVEGLYDRLDSIMDANIERWDNILNTKEVHDAIAQAKPQVE